jgi:hypothetical protein
MGNSAHCTPSLTGRLLLQPDLDEGLVRHVSGITVIPVETNYSGHINHEGTLPPYTEFESRPYSSSHAINHIGTGIARPCRRQHPFLGCFRGQHQLPGLFNPDSLRVFLAYRLFGHACTGNHPGTSPLDAPKVDFFSNHGVCIILDICTAFKAISKSMCYSAPFWMTASGPIASIEWRH